MGLPSAVAADEEGAADSAVMDEITITGSRRKARSPDDTPSPVDVITASDFKNQGGGDMVDLIRNIVPSYNVSPQAISDAATLIRPANLRGLPPDDILILVNGKRRHRAAVIAFSGGGLADGAQGPDISVIPSIALKQVEILRDGAAAQYGSDAIAGVMNFILDDSAEGGSIEAKYGETYSGDGAAWQVAGTIGTTLGENGFIRGSVEYREADPTVRSVQRTDALGLIAAGNKDVRQPFAQIWGSPQVNYDFKSFVNFAVEAGDNMELYGFGNYSERKVTGGFFFRNPNTRGGVFSSGKTSSGERIRLVGDMTPNDGMTCSGGINFATGNVDNPLIVGSAGESAALASIFADPNCFVFNEKFPGGFTPNFGGVLNDIAGVMGLRGEFSNGVTYDVSMSAGRNEADFFIDNTVNASLGSATPTFFQLGSYTELEKNFNADFSYPLETGIFASPLNIAAGFEWREEQFTVGIGQEESFKVGILSQPFTIPDDLTTPNVDEFKSFTQGFSTSANGFPGFGPKVAGTDDRTNVAFYLDMETDVTDDLVLGFAVRYEDFSDFGTTTNYKLSGLYHVTDEFTLRSTYSTGFRAPTVGQQKVSNVSTVFETNPLTGQQELVQRGTIPPTNPVSVILGGKQLRPETSDSYSLGLAYSGDLFSITVDYFNIKVSDRISQTSSQTLTAQNKADLAAAGVSGANEFTSIRFFSNAFSTKTQGVDVVMNIPLDIVDDGTTNLSFSGNWTETKVTGDVAKLIADKLLNPVRIDRIEENLPHYRGNATLNHTQGNIRGLVRVNYYGSYNEHHLGASKGSLGFFQPGAKITVDAEVGITFAEQFELIVGAQNLFNTFPAINPARGQVGAKYSTTSPFGFNGGFYYTRVVYNF